MVDDVSSPGVERRAHVAMGPPKCPPIYHTIHEMSVPQHARLHRYLKYGERHALKHLNVRACAVRSANAHAMPHSLNQPLTQTRKHAHTNETDRELPRRPALKGHLLQAAFSPACTPSCHVPFTPTQHNTYTLTHIHTHTHTHTQTICPS